MNKIIIAIVPAAGLGTRFDASERKTFVQINGMPLLAYTLKRFQTEDSITEIIPVLRTEDMDTGFEIAERYHLDKIKRIAPGGRERQDSIYNAMRLIREDGIEQEGETFVIIHDGARPCVPDGIVDKLADAAEGVAGVIPGLPLKDTIKEIDTEGNVTATLNRDRVRAVQTPQLFSFKVLVRAYEKAFEDGFYATDDAALVERTGGRIKIIAGSPLNIKVTTPDDLEMVQYILKKERNAL